jgi:hypothetical protein
MRVIIAAIIATLSTSVSAFAGEQPMIVTTPVPTLSEWGLIAMVCALGIIGVIVLRRRLTNKVG